MKHWGRIVYRRRVVLLIVALLVAAGAAVAAAGGAKFKDTNNFGFESIHAADLATQQLPKAGPQLGLVYHSATLTTDNPAFQQAVAAALAPARHDSRVQKISTGFDADAPLAVDGTNTSISRDHHAVIATLTLSGSFDIAREHAGDVIAEVTPHDLTLTTFGELAIIHDQDNYLASDLRFGALFSVPVALVLLLLIFGSVGSALVCLVIGLAGVGSGLAGTALLAHVMDVSAYADDIVGLVGLGVGIDYSLFIVSRFREELAKGEDTQTAIARTMETAGHAVSFSGVTVAVGLAAMLFFRGTFLVSMGLAGAIVVGTSLFFALTLLPALLSLLGPRINWLSLRRSRSSSGGMWRRIANVVMRHPIVVLIPTAAILVLLGSPFPQIKLANAEINVLPPHAQSRLGTESELHDFPDRPQSTVMVVLQFAHGGPTDAGNIAAAYALSQRFAHLKDVTGVTSYVDIRQDLQLEGYQIIYSQNLLEPVQKELLAATTGRNIAVLTVNSDAPENSDTASALVRNIRAHDNYPGVSAYVDGNSAFNIDFIDFMAQHTPLALAFVMAMTFLILLVLLRSIVLPLKAVLMNTLSLSAAFGAMVWIFQQGHLSGLLNFTPSPIDPTLPILLFCIVFGLSMDYEVFLMTRMREAWLYTRDNRRAVGDGLQASGRLVTGAAAIMVAVFSAFAFGQVVLIKAIGLAMAVAVAVDATLVRALIVPALMRLLGSVNWWAPRWLRPNSD